MSKLIYVCSDCFDSIYHISPTAASLWLAFCDILDERAPYLEYRLIRNYRSDNIHEEEIALLERKGFLVSHENSKVGFWIVKLLGIDVRENKACIFYHKKQTQEKWRSL